MVRESARSGIKGHRITLVLIYFLAAIFIVSLIRSPGLVDKRSGIISLSHFSGYKPFQYRVLMPLLVRGIEAITPNSIISHINHFAIDLFDSRPGLMKYESEKTSPELIARGGYLAMVYLFLNTVSLMMFFLVLRQLADSLDHFTPIAYNLLPFGMILIIPCYFDFVNHSYDFLHLLLFTSGLLYLFRRQWIPYIIVFCLAVLNKETSALLLIVFALNNFDELPRKSYYRLLGLQIVIFLSIKSALYFIFIDNPGTNMMWQLNKNLNHLSNLSNYFRFQNIGKGMLYPYYLHLPLPREVNLPMLILLGLAIWYKWSEKPIFLRRAMPYLIAVIVLGLIGGLINELRAYYDALPIIYLLALSGVMIFARDLKQRIIKSISPQRQQFNRAVGSVIPAGTPSCHHHKNRQILQK